MKYIVIKILIKDIQNHIQFINENLEFVKLFKVYIIIKNYTGHKNSY